MDYSRWTEMQQNPPNPNPSIDPYAPIYTSHYPYYPHHSQNPYPNPNPNPNLPNLHSSLKPHDTHSSIYGVGLETGLRPPGIDSYPSLSSYPHSHGGYEAQPSVAYSYQTAETGSLAVPSSYYHDPNAVAQQNWAAKEAVRQYGANPNLYATGVTIPPNGTDQLVPANPNPTLWTNPTVRPRGNGTWRKGPKKTKIVQSAWCEVCRIDCNSKDVLDQHKLGKKHKKNLEKLKEAIAPAPVASAESNNPVIGPQENPDKGKAVSGPKTKKAAEPVEDLETKRRKIVGGGAAVDAVRACAICNVVCNSETVFNYHLAGQKHAAMVRKHAAAGTGVANAN